MGVTEGTLFNKNGAAWKHLTSYDGWKVTFIAFTCIIFTFGASTATMPLIYGQAMDEFGWTRTEATLFFTYKNLASAVVAIFILGHLMQRFELRTVMIGANIITALGMTTFLWIDSLFTYYLAGVFIGLGVVTVLITAKVIVSLWFVRNQGLAVGMTTVGVSVGGIFFPIIADILIEAYGWRVAFALLSLGIWCVSIPLYLWMAKPDPSEADILPEATHTKPAPEMAERIRQADVDYSFAELMKTGMFWLIIFAVFLTAIADSGVFQHTVLFLTREIGFDSRIAAATISGTFALGIIAKLLAGRIYDKFSIRGIQFWYAFLGISILLAFPLQGIITLVIFTLARGLAHGGLVSSDTAVMTKHCYGPRLLKKMLPVLTGVYTIGAAIGPVSLSMVYDHTGSYTYGFIAFTIMCFAAAAMLFRVYPHYRDKLLAIK